MNAIDLNLYTRPGIDLSRPTPLFQDAEHAIYWLGLDEETAFRCNVYLVADGDEFLLFDPGSRAGFEAIKARVAQIVAPELVSGLIVCHQDPDVAASMTDWLEMSPDIKVYASQRTHALLPYYGVADYRAVDTGLQETLPLPSGAELRFLEAPFLHFPGAVATYDTASKFLFSGDVWAAVGADWTLAVSDFASHAVRMDMFHIDYMASNRAARGFVQSLAPYPIDAILPQHASIIPKRFVGEALRYLEELECGLDLLYPDLQD
jgi:flavorubredoxin